MRFAREAVMTQSMKRAILTLSIWGPVAVIFSMLFFVYGHPATYADNQSQRYLVSGILAAGYVGYGVMMYLTRKRRDDDHLVSDERDEVIATRASMAGLIIVAIYVFLLALGLWEHYQEHGAVPVGWMWFMAYSTVCLSYVGTSLPVSSCTKLLLF